MEQATKTFTEKYPWIKVNAIHIPEADYDAKITAMVAGNDSPDLGYMHGELADPWQKEGKFVNLFELLDNDGELKREDFLVGRDVRFILQQGFVRSGECSVPALEGGGCLDLG